MSYCETGDRVGAKCRQKSLPFRAHWGTLWVPFRGSSLEDSFYGTESVELKANKLDRPGVFTLVYPRFLWRVHWG